MTAFVASASCCHSLTDVPSLGPWTLVMATAASQVATAAQKPHLLQVLLLLLP